MLRQSYLHADTLGILHVCMRKKKHSILKMKIMVKTTLSGLQVQFVHLSVWVWVCVCMCMCLLNGIGEDAGRKVHATVKKWIKHLYRQTVVARLRSTTPNHLLTKPVLFNFTSLQRCPNVSSWLSPDHAEWRLYINTVYYYHTTVYIRNSGR